MKINFNTKKLFGNLKNKNKWIRKKISHRDWQFWLKFNKWQQKKIPTRPESDNHVTKGELAWQKRSHNELKHQIGNFICQDKNGFLSTADDKTMQFFSIHKQKTERKAACLTRNRQSKRRQLRPNRTACIHWWAIKWSNSRPEKPETGERAIEEQINWKSIDCRFHDLLLFLNILIRSFFDQNCVSVTKQKSLSDAVSDRYDWRRNDDVGQISLRMGKDNREERGRGRERRVN